MNERQLIRQARLQINYEIEQLNDQRCERDCQKPYVNCDCPTGTKLRQLGKVLDGGKSAILAYYQKGVQDVTKGKVEKTLTVEEYQKYKSEGQTDRQIMKKLGWYHQKLNTWKHLNGLIGKQGPMKNVDEPKDDSAERIKELERQLTYAKQWKAENVSLGESDLKNRYRITELEDELQEVKTKLGYALQWEDRYNQLKAQSEKSLEWEKEYRKLEIDYRNEVTETKRLKDMLGNLKYTERINVYLMERHVGFMRQLDEVME